MRRLLALVPAAPIVALAACGSSGPAGGPRGTELSYFPRSAPFVMTIETDPSSTAVKNGQALLGRFPALTFAEAALMSRLQQLGINYRSDIRPLFGNPLAVGAVTPTVSGTARNNNFLVVWVTRDAGKLSALAKKAGLHSSGSHGGATLYQSANGSTLAVDGATAVLGNSSATVSQALDTHSNRSGFSSSDADRDLSGLPKNTLVQVVGSLSGALSTPRAANARRVPWVAALRGFGTTINASSSGLSFSYRLDTSGGNLSPSELPLQSASSAPSFAAGGPIQVALNDPAQLVSFIESAEQVTSPASYARFLKRQASIRAKTGADLNSLLKLLTGASALSSDTHATVARLAVSDPGAAAQTLSKLVTQPQAVFSGATKVSKLGGGFYALKEPKQTITIGVAGNQLLVGRASIAQLRAFAAAPSTPAPAAQGSLAFRVSLAQLLHLAIKRAPPKAVQTILGSIGDFTGWAQAKPDALTGNATLGLK